MIEHAIAIASLIEVTINVDRVTGAPSEPAATDGCSAAYVWGIRVFDSDRPLNTRGDDADCFYRRAYEYGYRIDLCHKIRDDGKELSDADSLAEATELYDMMDAVYCALTQAAAFGTLFEVESCEYVSFGDLVPSTLGDRNSARGTIKVTSPCVMGS
jgi:hypothetical protein